MIHHSKFLTQFNKIFSHQFSRKKRKFALMKRWKSESSRGWILRMFTYITQEKSEETHKDSAYNLDKKAHSYKKENNPLLIEDDLFTKKQSSNNT